MSVVPCRTGMMHKRRRMALKMLSHFYEHPFHTQQIILLYYPHFFSRSLRMVNKGRVIQHASVLLFIRNVSFQVIFIRWPSIKLFRLTKFPSFLHPVSVNVCHFISILNASLDKCICIWMERMGMRRKSSKTLWCWYNEFRRRILVFPLEIIMHQHFVVASCSYKMLISQEYALWEAGDSELEK